jgi:hypothetical protein
MSIEKKQRGMTPLKTKKQPETGEFAVQILFVVDRHPGGFSNTRCSYAWFETIAGIFGMELH